MIPAHQVPALTQEIGHLLDKPGPYDLDPQSIVEHDSTFASSQNYRVFKRMFVRSTVGNQKPTLSSASLWLDLVMISGAWGSSFLFTKLISHTMPPFAFAATRGFIAALALLAWMAVRKSPSDAGRRQVRLPSLIELRHIMVFGTTNGWLANVMTFVAVSHLDTATAAILQATVPLIVAALSHFILPEERLSVTQAVGIVAGLLGVALIIGPIAIIDRPGSMVGIGAMLVTAFSYAAGILYGRYVAPHDPAALACGQQAFGASVAAVIAIGIGGSATWGQTSDVWALLVVVGVLCSAVPTVLFLRLLTRTTAVRSALVAYLQPVWAGLLGWAVLEESISGLALTGTGLIFIGIFAVTRDRQR